jgi:hypothetical protein
VCDLLAGFLAARLDLNEPPIDDDEPARDIGAFDPQWGRKASLRLGFDVRRFLWFLWDVSPLSPTVDVSVECLRWLARRGFPRR